MLAGRTSLSMAVGSCRLGLCRSSFTGRRCFPTGFSGGGFVIVLLMRRYLNKRLGGYTGTARRRTNPGTLCRTVACALIDFAA